MIKNWKSHFQDISCIYRFPLDKPKENPSSTGITTYEFKLPRELYVQLKDFCETNNCTLFSVLYTAWSLLFSRFTGSHKTISGLHAPHLKGTENHVIPCLSSLLPDDSFLTKVHHNIDFFNMAEYKGVGLSQIFNTLDIDPTHKHHPFYQTQFSYYESIAPSPLADSKISIGKVPLDVDLKIYASSQDCTIVVYYASDILLASSIQRILKCYEKILTTVIRIPDQPMGTIDILPREERQKILVDWNDTAWDYPHQKTFHQLFEEQADKTPDTIALICEDQNITYRKLNEKANQLARHLRTQGIGPEVPVAIACDRSIEMIIGIFGVLKAGGAYVPMDPAYPQDRLTYMLEDTKATVLLTQSWIKDKIPTISSTVIELDLMDKFLEEYPTNNLEALSKSSNLAYIIYTSGSTGKPKGVMIENKSLVNYITWCSATYPANENKGSVIHAPLIFDMSITSLFFPLISGNCVHIMPPKYDPESLIEAYRRQDDYSFIKLTPSHLKLIEMSYDLKTLEKYHNYFILGGEELKYEHIAPWLELNPERVIFNQYGPTEATVACTLYVTSQKDQHYNSVPIGKPIWNTSFYILDEALRPVPIGVIGELYIGGDCLARGYLNLVDLTADRFISNPFMTEKDQKQNRNTRLYKTGDLCRYHEDGNIEYAGRIDHQIKIRGFRVELGEIESALLVNPTVQEGVVLVLEDESGDKQLVSYYVPKTNQMITPHELREFLKTALPDYMIPSFFVPLEFMPLSPNGKLNRKALPHPSDVDHQSNYVAARTPTEKMLVTIWQDILHLKHVGINDNFFEMGGDSLKVIRVLSRLKEHRQIEIPYRYFFDNPTIAALSYYLENNKAEKSLIPLIPVPRTQNIPLSFEQLSLLLDSIYISNLIYTIHLDGHLNYAAFEDALNDVVQRQEALRSAVIFPDNKQELPLQKIEEHVPITVSHMDLSAYTEHDKQMHINHLIETDKKKSFDLSKAPLFRCHLIKQKPREHLFIFTLHHLFFDLESLGILFRELSAFYRAKVTGAKVKLPPLPIQWADYTVWQWKYLQDSKLEENLSHWRHNLNNPPPELTLPIDYPRKYDNVPDIITALSRLQLILKIAGYFVNRDLVARALLINSFEGDQHSFEIPKAMSKALRRLSKQQNVTLYTTLLTAFYVLIYEYNPQDEIIIGSPFSNRGRVETEELIGYFINFLAFRTNLTGNPSFSQLLKRVKDVTLTAYDYPYAPWKQLLEHSVEQKDSFLLNMGRLMFNLEHPSFHNLDLEGIHSTKMPYENTYCECELVLIVREHEEDLSGCFKYRKNLFKKETVEQMSQRFISLLEVIIKNPDLTLSQLSFGDVTTDKLTDLPLEKPGVITIPQSGDITSSYSDKL